MSSPRDRSHSHVLGSRRPAASAASVDSPALPSPISSSSATLEFLTSSTTQRALAQVSSHLESIHRPPSISHSHPHLHSILPNQSITTSQTNQSRSPPNVSTEFSLFSSRSVHEPTFSSKLKAREAHQNNMKSPFPNEAPNHGLAIMERRNDDDSSSPSSHLPAPWSPSAVSNSISVDYAVALVAAISQDKKEEKGKKSPNKDNEKKTKKNKKTDKEKDKKNNNRYKKSVGSFGSASRFTVRAAAVDAPPEAQSQSHSVASTPRGPPTLDRRSSLLTQKIRAQIASATQQTLDSLAKKSPFGIAEEAESSAETADGNESQPSPARSFSSIRASNAELLASLRASHATLQSGIDERERAGLDHLEALRVQLQAYREQREEEAQRRREEERAAEEKRKQEQMAELEVERMKLEQLEAELAMEKEQNKEEKEKNKKKKDKPNDRQQQQHHYALGHSSPHRLEHRDSDESASVKVGRRQEHEQGKSEKKRTKQHHHTNSTTDAASSDNGSSTAEKSVRLATMVENREKTARIDQLLAEIRDPPSPSKREQKKQESKEENESESEHSEIEDAKDAQLSDVAGQAPATEETDTISEGETKAAELEDQNSIQERPKKGKSVSRKATRNASPSKAKSPAAARKSKKGKKKSLNAQPKTESDDSSGAAVDGAEPESAPIEAETFDSAMKRLAAQRDELNRSFAAQEEQEQKVEMHQSESEETSEASESEAEKATDEEKQPAFTASQMARSQPLSDRSYLDNPLDAAAIEEFRSLRQRLQSNFTLKPAAPTRNRQALRNSLRSRDETATARRRRYHDVMTSPVQPLEADKITYAPVFPSPRLSSRFPRPSPSIDFPPPSPPVEPVRAISPPPRELENRARAHHYNERSQKVHDSHHQQAQEEENQRLNRFDRIHSSKNYRFSAAQESKPPELMVSNLDRPFSSELPTISPHTPAFHPPRTVPAFSSSYSFDNREFPGFLQSKTLKSADLSASSSHSQTVRSAYRAKQIEREEWNERYLKDEAEHKIVIPSRQTPSQLEAAAVKSRFQREMLRMSKTPSVTGRGDDDEAARTIGLWNEESTIRSSQRVIEQPPEPDLPALAALLEPEPPSDPVLFQLPRFIYSSDSSRGYPHFLPVSTAPDAMLRPVQAHREYQEHVFQQQHQKDQSRLRSRQAFSRTNQRAASAQPHSHSHSQALVPYTGRLDPFPTPLNPHVAHSLAEFPRLSSLSNPLTHPLDVSDTQLSHSLFFENRHFYDVP